MSENDSIRNKTIGGAVWKMCERSLAQIINFVVSIILARLLLPDAYGIVALIMVFITICDKLVSSGFATSLIQKKGADNLDFSTVFYFSIVVAGVLYTVLFFTAPLIAAGYDKYDSDLLILVTRVIGIRIIISAVNSVQHAFVSKTMQFRRLFFSTIAGAVVSATVGIVMAYKGYGVWALVWQYLIASAIDTVVLWFTVKWRPMLKFSFERLKGLYSFGWKIFIASMIRTLYNDLRSLVIGIFYTPADLAYYNKGNSFPQLVESNVVGTIDSVMFPAMAKKQSDAVMRLAILRRSIKVSSFVLIPLLVGLAATAKPVILLLLGPNWSDAIIFMQILCFSFVLMPVEQENLQAIKAIGRSDVVLKQEIIKKVLGVGLLAASIPFGVTAIAVSMLLSAIVSAVVNAIPNRKLLGYGYKKQLGDILPTLILSGIMFGCVYPLSFLPINIYLIAVIQVIAGMTIYISLSAIFKNESFIYLWNMAKGIIAKVRKKKAAVAPQPAVNNEEQGEIADEQEHS